MKAKQVIPVEHSGLSLGVDEAPMVLSVDTSWLAPPTSGEDGPPFLSPSGSLASTPLPPLLHLSSPLSTPTEGTGTEVVQPATQAAAVEEMKRRVGEEGQKQEGE